MTWRDQHQKGSFRGAEFVWVRSESEVGRKTARHDYPLRDETYIEDMGKAPREFTLEVFVLGQNYMVARDKLIAALEEPGPGTLVHPTMGTMRVSVTGKVRISESTDDGGIARLSIPFVLAGENKFPAASMDTSSAVTTRSDAAIGAVSADFGKVFTVSGQPDYVSAAGESHLQKMTARLRALSQTIPSNTVTVPWLSDLQAFGNASATLLRSPVEYGARSIRLVQGLGGLTNDPMQAFGINRGLFTFGDDMLSISGTTPSRVQHASNQKALNDLVKRTAVIEASRSAAAIEYVSYQEAAAVRDELAARLDEHMESGCSDDVYVALTDLRAAMVKDINERGANLAHVVSFTPTITLPALVIAHQLYGDATQESEIVARNKISHPGFITGGRALEVLSA